MPEHLNPYWFIPMDGTPAPRMPLQKWTEGRLYTGYVEVRLQTLTPLHVAGVIDVAGQRMARRHFYQRPHPDTGAPVPTVEGSSLRGMLRAYLEALTNGVASSYVVGYPKAFKERHLGFWVGRQPTPGSEAAREFTKPLPPGAPPRALYGDHSGPYVAALPSHVALPDRLDTPESRDPVVDAVTALFGLVTLDRKSDAERESSEPDAVVALGGRVRFGDAVFSPSDLVDKTSLDLDAKASFGAPKVSRSNWWYFSRGEARVRTYKSPSGPRQTVEFVGHRLRGRKMYFHQDPERCTAYYRSAAWVSQAALVPVPTSCVRAGSFSAPFRIWFERLPESLLKLLLVALRPSCGVRHKLGALKPFGFGSVAFEAMDVRIRRVGPAALDLTRGPAHESAPKLLEFAKGWPALRADELQRRELSIGHAGQWLVDEKALSWLRNILYFPQNLAAQHRLFVYPPFNQRAVDLARGFARPVSPQEVAALGVRLPATAPTELDRVVQGLAPRRVTIDLHTYQTTARAWPAIQKEVSTLG